MDRRHLLERMIHTADLDGEPIPGKTLIEVMDNRYVLIENHCGVSQYCRSHISVKTKEGHICITGCNMVLTKMSRELLRIQGVIHQISIQGRD